MPNRPVPRNMRIVKPGDPVREERQRARKATVPPPPEYLSDDAGLHWSRIVREMVASGTWSPLYETTLVTYCLLLAEFHEKGPNFGASKLIQLRLLSGDLGLSPSAANRVARI